MEFGLADHFLEVWLTRIFEIATNTDSLSNVSFMTLAS